MVMMIMDGNVDDDPGYNGDDDGNDDFLTSSPILTSFFALSTSTEMMVWILVW